MVHPPPCVVLIPFNASVCKMYYDEAAYRIDIDQNRMKPAQGGEIRFHDLRHTYASMLIARNMNVKAYSGCSGTPAR